MWLLNFALLILGCLILGFTIVLFCIIGLIVFFCLAQIYDFIAKKVKEIKNGKN